MVAFDGEPARDMGGGVRREFVSILSREFAAETRSLLCRGDDASYFPRAGLGSTDALKHFRSLGRLLGLSLVSRDVIDFTLSPFVLKRIVGRLPTALDLQSVDEDLASKVSWILQNE